MIQYFTKKKEFLKITFVLKKSVFESRVTPQIYPQVENRCSKGKGGYTTTPCLWLETNIYFTKNWLF